MPDNRKHKKTDPTETLSYKVGDFVEQKIGHDVEKRFEAPVLQGEPERMIWYRIPIPEGMSGDGSEYHIYIKKADPKKVCVFLSGGGVAWNAYTAARPVTGGKVAAGLPNYYWNNLRPFTQIMNINTGITELHNVRNPFDDWSFIIITYATGDFHVGNHDFPYVTEDGTGSVLHFHGYKNFVSGMDKAVPFFPEPEKLLIAGDSAGAFAVPALAEVILEEYYPSCADVSLLSDSGQLLYRNWRDTARYVWGAEKRIWKAIHGRNLTVEWYRDLYQKYEEKLRYLYAGSVRDYLLSAYYNDVAHKVYKTDTDVREVYFHQMRQMVRDLKKITPSFGMFVYDWKNHRMMLGGTVHTAVRHKRFYLRGHLETSMADWLRDAVNGKVYDVGMHLLEEA